jgi:hypothetical protein
MKKTPIVTSLLLAGMLMTFNACKKNGVTETPAAEKKEVGAVTVENGRLAFTTNEDYYKYIDAVKPETSGKEGFRSLYTALKEGYKKTDSDPALSATLADLDQFEFPSGFLATLNEKGEVKIGNEIIWYHQGKKYWIPAGDEANLESVKQNPERIKKSFAVVTSTLKNARTNLDIRGLDARHQKEWLPISVVTGQPMVGSARKMVHEIYGRFDPYTDPTLPGVPLYNAYLILRMKMEWRGCCDWNPNASEERTVTINVNGFANLPGMSRFSTYTLGPNFNVSHSRVTRENVDVTLASVNGLGGLTNNNWDVEISGSIVSQFNGDLPQNAFNNVGYPLW